MEICLVPLFSNSHLDTASALFPDNVGDKKWHLVPWTLREISKLKSFESSNLDLNNNFQMSSNQKSVYKICNSLFKGKCASFGAGSCVVELNLAKENNQIIKFDCYDYEDNSEFIFNKCKELKVNNVNYFCEKIQSFSGDEKYDYILVNQVVYALSDEDLISFLSQVKSALSPQGELHIYCTSNLNLRKYVYALRVKIRILLGLSNYKMYKPIGWLRSVGELRSILNRSGFISSRIRIDNDSIGFSFKCIHKESGE